MSSLSEFVHRRWGSWGVVIFILWAVVLAVVAFARLLLLSKAVELYSNEFGNQAQVWVVFLINVGLGLGFAASAFGLWRLDNWGRLLFLWIVGIWSVFNLTVLFIVNPLVLGTQYSLTDILVNGLRLAGGLMITLWYFNLPHIKTLFQTESPENLITEE